MTVCPLYLAIASFDAFANDHAHRYAGDTLYITVRKQAENPALVPGVVQLINRETIENANINSPADISALTPGFSFNDPFGRYNPAPSIRGLTQPGLGDDPSVGFFNDGFYLSGRSSLNSLAFDLEKIEIAKGPQSALYGRNAFGGTINAASAKPSSRLEYWLDGRTATKDRQEISAGINAPVNDWISARLALYWRDWGGYFGNSVAGGPAIGRERTQAARLSLAFDPVPHRNILLRITHITDDDAQPAGFLTPANCGPRTSDGQMRLFCGDLPERPDGGSDQLAANDVGTDQDMGYDRLHSRATLEWTEKLSPRLTLTTLVGAAMEDSAFIRDDDYQSSNAARAGIDTDRFDTQFDTRLNIGSASDEWSGLIGFSGYHFLNHVDRIDQLYVSGQTRPGGPKIKNTTDTLGVYGSATHRWHNDIALTGDARWQWEEKTLMSSTTALTSGQPLDLSDSWTAFTPKLTLSWTAANNLLIYGSAAQGYKTGGFNDRANIFDSERMYDAEKNITYELGIKNVSLRNTLSADLGAFWIDWTDQQVLAYSTAAATQNFFLNNAGETTVKGLEATLRWTPSARLSFNLGYTYADARYDSYKDPDLANVQDFTPDGDVSGNRLPRYSPHQITAMANYRTPSPIKNWDIVSGAQFTFESSQYTDNSNTARTGERTLLNLQLGLETAGGGIGLFVNNALDEKDPAVGIPWTDATQSFRREWLVVPQEGATFGLRAHLKF